MKKARWTFRQTDKSLAEKLAELHNLSMPVAIALSARVSSIEEANSFLDSGLSDLPDPFLVADMDRAVERIADAIQDGERIVVWGDYDVDGITSTTLLVLFFRAIGVEVAYRIPKRGKHGYGLNVEGIPELAENGFGLMITVDNGIASLEEIAQARELGLDVVVCDHHQLADSLPEAAAVLDPRREDCRYPDKNLCAAGLTLILLQALRRHLVETHVIDADKAPRLDTYLEYVGLATVADVVSLTGINRILVREGLARLTRTVSPGMLALKEAAGIAPLKPIGSYEAGYLLGPRINAAGRMADPEAGVELLTTNDLNRARQIASMLNQLNLKRQAMEQDIFDKAVAKIESNTAIKNAPAIVVFGNDWHEGVVGIVASRLVDRYGKPSIVLSGTADGLARGSARSIKALHIKQALDDCSGLLIRYGGHKAAAGMTLEQKNLSSFAEAFYAACSQRLTEDDYRRVINIDCELNPNDITPTLMNTLDTLSPFGMGNPEPVFVSRKMDLASSNVMKEKHVKLSFRLNGSANIIKGMGFNMVDKLQPLQPGDWDVVYSPRWNEWGGRRTIEIRIIDMRPPEDEE